MEIDKIVNGMLKLTLSHINTQQTDKTKKTNQNIMGLDGKWKMGTSTEK